MPEEKVSYYEDFNEIEKKIWSLLTNAVKDRRSEFRTPVFICGNDKDLDGRVVVLRKADQENNFIQYHSDIRSSKIEKIKKNPSCSILNRVVSSTAVTSADLGSPSSKAISPIQLPSPIRVISVSPL